MTELPTGSLVGLVMFALVLGIVLGRSARFMRALGSMHASAHGGAATGGAATAHQSVSTVVVVDRDGQPVVDGRYVLDAEVLAPPAELSAGERPLGVDVDAWAAERAYEYAEDPR